MAKRLFATKGVNYQEIDVSKDPEKRKWLMDVTGRRTVPQIFINGEPYGGFTDVLALDQAGKLDAILGLKAESTAP